MNCQMAIPRDRSVTEAAVAMSAAILVRSSKIAARTSQGAEVSVNPAKAVLKRRPGGLPWRAEDRRVDRRPAGRGVAGLRIAQRPNHCGDIAEGKLELRQGPNPDDAHGPGVHQQGQDREQVLDLRPLEEVAQEQHRDTQPFQIAADGRETLVAGAEHGLVSELVARGPHGFDRIGDRHDLVVGLQDRVQFHGMA